ncbi:tRNA(Met) cytidine acetate ligase [Mogibacterium timidum]
MNMQRALRSKPLPMKVLGIVAEYNPLHNGHLYHIDRAKREACADAVIAVMSGDFVQRGELAFASKWDRAESAVKNGIDAVFEIPAFACLGNASVYASTAIKLLAAIGVVDVISFGSESGNIDKLTMVAERLSDSRISDRMVELAREGYSYPRSRAAAYSEFFGDDGESVLHGANDTLAIEYIRAITEFNKCTEHELEVHTIKREAAGYSARFDTSRKFQSASGIRQAARQGIDVSEFVPDESAKLISSCFSERADTIDDKLFDLIRYVLLNLNASQVDEAPQGGEGIGTRLIEAVSRCKSFDELVMHAKSKRYTYTRISRLLLQLLLNIKRDEPGVCEPGYLRVLAANETGRKLIKKAKKNSLNDIPIITNINREANELSDSANSQLLLDIRAADTYNILTMNDMYEESDHVKRPILL